MRLNEDQEHCSWLEVDERRNKFKKQKVMYEALNECGKGNDKFISI